MNELAEILEYVLLALACPLVLPFIEIEKGGDEK